MPTSINWPTQLPYARLDGYSDAPRTKSLELDYGHKLFRRQVYRDGAEVFSVSFVFADFQSQEPIFRNFYADDLDDGTLFFRVPILTNGLVEVQEMMFFGTPPVFVPQGRKNQVVMTATLISRRNLVRATPGGGWPAAGAGDNGWGGPGSSFECLLIEQTYLTSTSAEYRYTTPTSVLPAGVTEVRFYYYVDGDPVPTLGTGYVLGEFIDDGWYGFQTGLTPDTAYLVFATYAGGGNESTGCEAGAMTFSTTVTPGWDATTLFANTNLTNADRDLDSTVDDYGNRSGLFLPRGSSNLVYAEIWLPGIGFVEDAYDPFTNDPIIVGLAPTGVLTLGDSATDQAGVPLALRISGLYVADDSLGTYAGSIEVYKAGVYQAGYDLLRFAGGSGGSHRRIGFAWDVAGGFVYVTQGGVLMYGDPAGGSSPKPRITLAGSPTNLRLFAQNFVSARCGANAPDLIHPRPSGYTAWDGTT